MSKSLRPVVVGVSEKQTAVVRYALQEAVRLQTSLRVIHCYTLPAQASEFYFGGDAAQEARNAGDAVLGAAQMVVEAEDLDTEVTYVLFSGDPEALLLGEAVDAAAIVVGADDVTWLDKMLGGGVSGPLALKAPCPVIVVPRDLFDAGSITGVVVTLDGDTSAAGPLRYGFEQAHVRTESLHVLHASPVATTAQDARHLESMISEAVAVWKALTPEVDVRLSLTNGDALAACIEATVGASLLVVGRPHGHALSFALTRPVAMQVLREARCPVAIIPPNYG